MNRQEMLLCLDNIQQQIDRLRTIIQGSDHDVEQDVEKPQQNPTEIQQEDIRPSREVQFRDRIRSLLRLASSSSSEEDNLAGLRKIIHSDTSSSDVALGRLQRFNFSRLKQQYSQYLLDANDFDSFTIEREEKRGFSDIVEYKVFVLANVRKPVPLTFRKDPKHDQWMIYSFSL
tara:strand:- start:11 stop:532 length:522 start_codon:yes stop_codon:yes gene_type:complete